MEQHARRTPVPVALWSLLVLLLSVVCGTGPAVGAPAVAPPVGSLASVTSVTSVTGSADPARPALSAPDSPPAADGTRAQGLHVSAAVQHTRLPGLPGAVPGPVTGPLAVPLPTGEAAGPRQERAPPAAAPSSRRTRGPPSTRSI
ncbi:hypothetical protein [Streptomyces rectiverticillatus]|uniref:hypothetical protein n=1 Tax=Streptomyces rectiverticillatus TaxID=173860 RepID=UPI0015C2C978|nr:hypothetical protein [Streptomyces rectiverticillatus]